MTKERPTKKFKVGGIAVAIWANQAVNPKSGQPETFHSIKLERRYKDKGGDWQSSDSMRTNDLPKAILALSKAYEFIVLEEPEQETGGDAV